MSIQDLLMNCLNALSEGRIEEALALAERAVADRPDLAWGHLLKGRALKPEEEELLTEYLRERKALTDN